MTAERFIHRDHVFGQDIVRPGERRTVIVVIITAVMMIVEIVSGLLFGSMALLADGLHMASHAAALGVSVAAYKLARKYARDVRFSFGTGKLNSLAAFTSAIMLAMFALLMAYSVRRFFRPSGLRLIRPSSSPLWVWLSTRSTC
jgi:cation diffusion facilitator family transporter